MLTVNNVGIVDGNCLITNNLFLQMLSYSETSSQKSINLVKQLSNSNQEPFVIFTPCSNSHLFEERRIPITRSEEQAVKIGRAVLRSQPTSNNAMFDCKVFFQFILLF